ncbi:hypothetical protein [Streptomyces sp. NPDC048636]|uniref:hypothetical protein n=1 Tax=Streptomyces sp. NPDC048636 TaxID=3155762 RepID=UPI00344585ED
MFLLLLLPAGLVATFGLAGYGLGLIGRVGLRRADRGARLRIVAALLGCAAAALYTWGLLIVASAVLEAEDGGTDSSPIRPCRIASQGERVRHVIDYHVDYVPLRFICELTDGGSYADNSVPGYVNPAVLTFALTAAVSAGAASRESRRVRR